MELMEHQLEAIERLGNGKILYGGVGSGKSAAVLGYYMKAEKPRHIFVITTAKKRDSLDWEREAANFGISTCDGMDSKSLAGFIEIDSWNNLWKYTDVQDAFFIFDEQRLVGHGAWVKSFLKIAQKNHWVLLSATPGDSWMDYAPVFVANGFYRNLTDFKRKHVLYEPFIKYPKIRGYLNEQKLEVLRNDMLVEMPYLKETTRNLNYIEVGYDKVLWKRVTKDRWNVFEDRPIKDAAELFRMMRKVANTDRSRLETIRFLMRVHPKLVIFYNFNYELELLKTLQNDVVLGEWNGHQKDPIPGTDNWVYLVQYTAGAEGWNCTETDAMVLYSLTFSYKNFVQSQGRIDRLNTKFRILYYYILMSNLKVDRGIKEALDNKRDFNWRKFAKQNPEFRGF